MSIHVTGRGGCTATVYVLVGSMIRGRVPASGWCGDRWAPGVAGEGAAQDGHDFEAVLAEGVKPRCGALTWMNTLRSSAVAGQPWRR